MSGGLAMRAEVPACVGIRRESVLVDLVHLSKYTLGDRSLECELLGLFRSQSGVYLQRLETAASLAEWKDVAHSLKGSARGIGAWAVGDQAEMAEQMADLDGASREDALIKVRGAIDETIAHVAVLLAD
ncbi:MAG: Hpt domain-containing protein [Rhodobiaceae bacterium]|nr:Hpt domain-containing protein [Rhodobiaceae bacterium]